MTAFDLIMIGVVIVGGLIGSWKGITKQLATVGALAAGYLVAWPLSASLAPQLPGPPWAARGLAVVLIYLVTAAAIFLTANTIRMMLKRSGMIGLDRHLGMISGALSGAAVGLGITLAYLSLVPEARPAVWATGTGKVAAAIWGGVRPAVPETVRAGLDPLVDPNAAPTAAPETPAAAVDRELRNAAWRGVAGSLPPETPRYGRAAPGAGRP